MHEVVKGGYTVKQLYAVYRSRVIVTDYRTKKLAIYPSLRKAQLYCQTMNSHGAGYYCAEAIIGKTKRGNNEKVN